MATEATTYPTSTACAADQAVQAVDVEVQGAGMPIGVKRRQGGLADARRPVQLD